MAFVKGQSGNPNGRPKTQRAMFSEEIMRLCHEQNLHKAVIAKMARMALDGDVQCMKMIIERIEGKATTRVEVSTGSLLLQDFLEGIVNAGGVESAPDGEVAD